ncbi:hypothetical protein FB451DRAFT_1576395 [Mycena latifolia]|nr:hypothetical protein FB451DRAFT_1576395 [Mycena latifolia]
MHVCGSYAQHLHPHLQEVLSHTYPADLHLDAGEDQQVSTTRSAGSRAGVYERSCISILVPTFIIAPPVDALFSAEPPPPSRRLLRGSDTHSSLCVALAAILASRLGHIHRHKLRTNAPRLRCFQARRPWRASIAHCVASCMRRSAAKLPQLLDLAPRGLPTSREPLWRFPPLAIELPGQSLGCGSLTDGSYYSTARCTRGVLDTHTAAAFGTKLGVRAFPRSRSWDVELAVLRHADAIRSSAASPARSTAARLIVVAPSPSSRQALAQPHHRRLILIRDLSWFTEGFTFRNQSEPVYARLRLKCAKMRDSFHPTERFVDSYDTFRGHLPAKRFRQSFIGRLIGIVSPRLWPAPACRYSCTGKHVTGCDLPRASVHQVAASSESLLSGRLLPCGFRLPVCASFCPSPSLRVKGFLTGDGSIPFCVLWHPTPGRLLFPSHSKHPPCPRIAASVMIPHGWHPRLFGVLEAPPARVEPAGPNPMPRPRSSPMRSLMSTQPSGDVELATRFHRSFRQK